MYLYFECFLKVALTSKGVIKGDWANAGQILDKYMNVGVISGNASLHREEFIYRINDSPEGVEAAQHRKHMLDGICNGGQL